jgi:hypothetical protein
MKRASLVLALIALAGCPGAPGGGGGGGGNVETSLILNEGLGTFDVEAGVPQRRTGTVTFSTAGGALQGGTLEITPSAITVEPGGAKNAVLLQGGVLTVTVWIAPLDAEETVCDTGEQYGPYAVTLDESNVPVAIDPSTVELTDTTLDLLTLGQFSICIEVVSPIDATVTIQRFQINLDF